MRFDSIDPQLVLGTVNRSKYQQEEEPGFLDKFFHKNRKNEASPFDEAIEKIGRDVLRQEIQDDEYILAYTLDENRTDLYVVMTENYLIIPDKDIISFEDVVRYGLFNELEPDFSQYAEDRLNIPYDPTFKSEYEGEDTYELDRFSILFSYVDQFGICYRYTIYMDVADRKEFYEYLSARLEDKVDWTDPLVLEGRFEEDPLDNPYYKMIR